MKTSHLEDRTFRFALAASLVLILFGARAALIGFAGSPFPYMDEWDGDWGGLIRPYLDGTLSLGAFTAPFNEHRILFTRLLTLGIFHLSGYWDVVLQMIVNAVLASALLVGVAFALARVLGGRFALAAVLGVSLVNVVPVAFDNILLGFNTHFYLLPALSLGAVWLAADSRAFSLRWTAGAALGLAAFFCMASGALTLAAIAATHALQMACRRRAGVREALGIAALIGASVLLLTFIPHVPQSDAFRAHSPGAFLAGVGTLLEWPAGRVFGWLLPLPSALFLVKTLADRPDRRDPRWFNVAALAWVAAQIAALAAGRAEMLPQSRYFDTLLLGLALHFVSALWLVETQAFGPNRRRTAAFALAVWVALLGVTLPRAEHHLPRQIEAWRVAVETGGARVRFYLATGDGAYLSGRPGLELPYPDADILRAYLDAPEARAALPPLLLSRPEPRNRIETLKRGLLGLAPVEFGLGALALLVLLFWRWSLEQELRSAARAMLSKSWEAPA